MQKIRNFRDLDVWKLGKDITLIVYRLTERFPHQETYGLTAQMRRAAVSIPSNVGEGFNRHSNREERQFLYASLGSCAELETQVEIGCELGYCTTQERDHLLELLQAIPQPGRLCISDCGLRIGSSEKIRHSQFEIRNAEVL